MEALRNLNWGIEVRRNEIKKYDHKWINSICIKVV